jgi:GAF domain-containing protein
MIAQEAIYRCLNPACVFTSFLDRKTGEVVGRLYAGHSVLAKSRDFHFSMNDSRMLVVKALQAKRTMQAPMGGTEICPAINLLEDMELAQVCMTPILVGRQVVGGYFVGRSVDIPFSSEDIKWLDAIAGHVGMAIELSP